MGNIAEQDLTVDLSQLSIPKNKPFLLSCNVVFGNDNWDPFHTFTFDPNSNLIAVAQKYGPVRGGGLNFMGTIAHDGVSSLDTKILSSDDVPDLLQQVSSILRLHRS